MEETSKWLENYRATLMRGAERVANEMGEDLEKELNRSTISSLNLAQQMMLKCNRR